MLTVFMPVYNGENYLQAAINSILAQSFQDFELLIIDDGSTDRSAEIIRSFDSKKIRFLQNEQNKGLIFTQAKAIAASSKKYWAVLDCDDWAYPQRLEKQIRFLEQNPDYAAVGSWVESIDAADKHLGIWKLPYQSTEIRVKLLFQNCFAHSAMMLRRKVLDEMSYRVTFYPSEDYDLWVRISRKYKLANLPEVLLKYRIHTQSISQTQNQKQHTSVLKIIEEQLAILQIFPSQNQLDTHLQLAHLEKNIDFERLKTWLEILYEQNNRLAIYPKTDFENLLLFYWQEVVVNRKMTFKELKQFTSFSLSKKMRNFWKILLKNCLP